MFAVSVGQTFRKNTVRMACLCIVMPGVTAGRLSGDDLKVLGPSDSSFTHMSGAGCWLSARTPTCDLFMWLVGLPHSMVADFHE